MAEAASDPDKVELTIGDRVHGGWTGVSIEIGLDAIASAFSLQVTDRWPGQQERFDLKAGAGARVSIGGETVITGFIDTLESSLTGDAHSISISGRSKAGDLVDCAAVAKPGSWRGRKLEEIAGELAKPFGITVTAKVSTAPPLKVFVLQQGESVFETIERMCRMRGLLAVSDAEGNVAIVSPKPAGAAVRLKQGEHLLAVEGRHDVSERFSRYLLKGQAAGDDDAYGRTVSEPSAEVSDRGVARYRPIVIVAEDQADVASLRKRASWEATVRAAKAQEANVDVASWRQPGGSTLWQSGQLVALDAPAAWMQADLLVASVTFSIDDQGKRATLKLVRPEAYSQLAIPEQAQSSAVKK